MARLQLIIPLFLWAIWLNGAAGDASWLLTGPATGAAIYLGSILLLIAAVRVLARRAMRQNRGSASAAIGQLHRVVFTARWLLLVLHAFALYSLGFGLFILQVTPNFAATFDIVPAFLSLLPVAAAWLGLVWAQHPLDRAVREQNALFAFEFGEPIYPIPSFGQHILAAFRLQILFTLVPVLAIGLMRDIAAALLRHFGRDMGGAADLITTLAAMFTVFFLSPELLRRVLPTHPLPASELRDGLEALCVRLQLRYREILLWRTHHTLDNAAVMGIVPQVRYILLSDLLIATMTQQQVEAVFAHEAGHVVHRHMVWYLIFFQTLGLSLTGLAGAAMHWSGAAAMSSFIDAGTLTAILGIVLFFICFGALSRNMERQADVFAAATMTSETTAAPRPRIGRDGVALFCSALAKVARVNNMPLDNTAATLGKSAVRRLYARIVNHSANWLHGSIRSRLDYLQSLVDAPQRVSEFDRKMIAVRVALLAAFVASIALTVYESNLP